MKENRIEKDKLGKQKIDNNSYWGIHTQRALENFPISDLRLHPEFVKSMALVKYACALTNQQLGFLSKQKAQSIQSACKKIYKGKFNDQFMLDALQGGAGTSTNMNFNEVIANIALEELGHDKGNYDVINPLHDVNKHQSTNDVYPTALKIAALKLLKTLEKETAYLQEDLQKKEIEFQNVIKLGRTQLQDAVPMTLGMEFGAYADTISRDRWRIFKSRERIKIINIGGTAIGTGLGAPRDYIFKLTENLRNLCGLSIARGENLVDATQNLDSFVEVSGMLKAYASNLFKISSDLRLLNSGPNGGINEIDLPAVQTGSSIMPDKINPVIPEAVSQIALKVFGNDYILTQAVSLGQLELNQFIPVINHSLLETLEILINGSIILREKCIKGIKANKVICESNLKGSKSIAASLVPILGYQKVEELIERSRSENIDVKSLILEENLMKKEELNRLLSAENLYKLGFSDEIKKGG